jgi:dTDP-D-glucose 4,6-dehydratase
MPFWPDQRVVVTGGAGFLGRRVVAALRDRGCSSIAVPRAEDCDLRQVENVSTLYRDFEPTLVIHLAAIVGGIGANTARPAEFFYDNLMIGTQLLHEAACRRQEVRRHRHGLHLHEARAGAVSRRRSLERLSRGDERAVRARQEDAPGAVTGPTASSTATTQSFCCP